MIPTTAKLGLVPGWPPFGLERAVAFLFPRRIVFLVRLLRLGRGEDRFDRIPSRLKRVLVYVFGQTRLLEEPLVGVPHLLIFYGFLVFLLATTGMLLQGLLPGLSIPTVEENRYLAPVVDLFAVLVLTISAVSFLLLVALFPVATLRALISRDCKCSTSHERSSFMARLHCSLISVASCPQTRIPLSAAILSSTGGWVLKSLPTNEPASPAPKGFDI